MTINPEFLPLALFTLMMIFAALVVDRMYNQ